MADLYLTPAEKYTAALGGFYYGDLPEPGTVYTQLIKDILDGSTPDKEPKNILARFIYSLYISDLGDPYPRYELAKLLYWKLHNITPTKSGSVLTVTIDGKEDYMTINTDLSRLWYKVLFGSKTDIITEFPYIFNAMQNKLSDWELFGNTVQSGTQTHDNPVMPQGTGERTGNLIDVANLSNVRWATPYPLLLTAINSLPNGVYTMSISFELTSRNDTTDNSVCGWYITKDSRVLSNTRCSLETAQIGEIITAVDTFTIDDNNRGAFTALYLYGCGINGVGATGIANAENIILNLGSTALPYEPYGYKIPISSANTTTNVYLGEVETTRKIKKLVLTGEENWAYEESYSRFWISVADFTTLGLRSTPFMSNAFSAISDGRPIADVPDNTIYSGATGGVDVHKIFIKCTTYTTLNDWESYLAAQYAAGTPVTVWYVLATETTGIVNEPLMKIGEYADSLSRAKTGIDIPTVVGQNTLDVLTTVKPSSMSIEYTSADENRSRSKRISLLKSPLKKRLIK